MKPTDVLLRKFMDGELSDDERKELEEQLTPDALERLKQDKTFQEALAEKLKDAPHCPDPLWQKLKAEMMGDVVAEHGEKFPRMLSLVAIIAICVGLVAILVFNEPGRDGNFVSDVFLFQDIESFSKQADLHGSQSALADNLKRNGFTDLTFTAKTTEGGHKITPLGIRYQTFKKQRVAQILFDCCNKPVVVIIAPKGLPIDPMPFRFTDETKGSVQTKEIGNYTIIAGAQDHTPAEAMRLFTALNTDSANVH